MNICRSSQDINEDFSSWNLPKELLLSIKERRENINQLDIFQAIELYLFYKDLEFLNVKIQKKLLEERLRELCEKKKIGENMNIYRLTQDITNEYDTYDGVIVAANSEEEARNILPTTLSKKGLVDEEYKNAYGDDFYLETIGWVTPDQVKVELLGVANESIKESCVLLASFNAGQL